ncbi:MAG: hypothetical protein J5594_01385 [Elusimicrobiaceae bacterium]|nr:hypothetical protein [Elusimicrobiaceae bacterium]
MKRYWLFLFIIFSTVLTCAAPMDPYAHHQSFAEVNKRFFKKLISEEEATCMICIHRDSTKKYLDEKTVNKIFLDSIHNWLNGTKEYIRDNKAENNFRDILKIIENANIKILPCEVDENDRIKSKIADMLVFFTEDTQTTTNLEIPKIHSGTFISKTGDIIIKTFPKLRYEQYVATLTHELGHAFGLADQYSGATYQGSFWYNSNIKRPSIMDKSKHITCDDIDGFITTIDRLRNAVNPSLNLQRGFYSLCNDGLFIKNGRGEMKHYQAYDFHENYEDFDANITIYETKDAQNALIVYMTLENFILSKEGLSLVKNMGFKVDDYDTLKNIKIDIGGPIIEKPSKFDAMRYERTPIGGWHLALSVKQGDTYNLKQEIFQEIFPVGKKETELFDFDNFAQITLSDEIIIPLINYYPQIGYGKKEKIRKEYENRHNPLQKIEKSIKNIEKVILPKNK